MADKKISELDALSGADTADGDALIIADVSAGLTKKLTFGELKNALDTGSGFVRITGDTMTGDLALSGADVTFGDNDKAIFGAGSDLEIYHSGVESLIKDTGTGDLKIQAADFYVQNSGGTQTNIYSVSGGASGLSHAGANKLATTATGIDVTGTILADGLTVQADVSSAIIESTNAAGEAWKLQSTYNNTGGAYGSFQVRDEANNIWMRFNQNNGSDEIDLRTTNKDRLSIASTGDIEFYASDGTTQAFHWDAADERLGIGTTAPTGTLSLHSGSSNHLYLSGTSGDAYGGWVSPTGTSFSLGSWSNGARINFFDSSEVITFGTGPYTAERMRISSDGNVKLHEALVQDEVRLTTTATTQVTIETFAHASYDGAKVVITAATAADTYVTELLIATNGTTAVATEYGQIGTGSALATYDVDISGANVQILATPASATSTAFKVAMTLT